MRPRLLHILVLAVLVGVLSGTVRVVAAGAVVDAQADCCEGCEDADCPDQEGAGEGCPPQCSDCVCASFAVPGLALYLHGDIGHVPDQPKLETALGPMPPSPFLRGVFRPPRPLVRS